MTFKQFNTLLKAQFTLMLNMGTLYSVDTNEEQLTEVYLSGFKNDPVFRCDEASQHDCRNCFKFLRDMGHAIVLDENNNIVTLFDFEIEDEIYAPVAKAMSEFIKSRTITNIFLLEFKELFKAPYEAGVKKNNTDFAVGMPVNYKRYTDEEAALYPDTVEVDKQYEFHHLHARVPAQYVNTTNASIASLMAEKRDIVSVFARGMREVSIETLEIVQDLAERGALRDGGTYLPGIKAYIQLKNEYLVSEESTRANWC